MTWAPHHTTYSVAVINGRCRVWAVRTGGQHTRTDLIADTPVAAVGLTPTNPKKEEA